MEIKFEISPVEGYGYEKEYCFETRVRINGQAYGLRQVVNPRYLATQSLFDLLWRDMGEKIKAIIDKDTQGSRVASVEASVVDRGK